MSEKKPKPGMGMDDAEALLDARDYLLETFRKTGAHPIRHRSGKDFVGVDINVNGRVYMVNIRPVPVPKRVE